jgi:2-oxoglutarate ferredoxin oxidoreductase subunit beta
MKVQELNTKEEITWCPGCLNSGILAAVKQAIVNLSNKGNIEAKGVVTVTGIGCHAKIYDYLNVNGFYSIHGRVIPTVWGMKLANPKLTVIGFGGDGDTYAEGIGHFVHACRYNPDATMIVHNNQVFALTTGQATPTTEQGFKGKSTPLGVGQRPLNPITLALTSGATFVARGFALDVNHLTGLIEQAIEHKGFGFIDVLQPCLIYHNHKTVSYFKENTYKLGENNHNVSSYNDALKKALEWDYCFDGKTKIPIGVFYKTQRPTYEEQWKLKEPLHTIERKVDWKKVINEFK